MIDVFREIEKGREAKYKLDEELRFKAECRRNRLLGAWTAGHLGLDGTEAEAYARRLVRRSLDAPGYGAVVDMVREDLDRAAVEVPVNDILAAFERCQSLAVAQIAADYPTALDVDHVQVGG
jgi:hypothetical protein